MPGLLHHRFSKLAWGVTVFSLFCGKGLGVFISTNKNKHGGVTKGDGYQGNKMKSLNYIYYKN